MTILDQIILLVTGLLAIYLMWRFYGRYQKEKALYDIYYMLGFTVLLVSGLILIFLGWGILASPYVLTVASLILLGISLGIANQHFPQWKKLMPGSPCSALSPSPYPPSLIWEHLRRLPSHYSTVWLDWSSSSARSSQKMLRKAFGGSASVVH